MQLTGWRIDIKSETKMREIAEWLSRAVSVIEDCGDPEADLLLQQGITSLEDLSECPSELLTSLPGIDEAGAELIKSRAAELVSVKVVEEEEKARLEAEAEALRRAEVEAEAATEAASGETTGVAAGDETQEPPSGPALGSDD